MQIQNINSTNTFTSLNNPIVTETFISRLGKITMQEAQSEDIIKVAKLIRRQEANSYKLNHFYGKDAEEQKQFYKSINKNSWLKDIKEYLVKLLKKPDGNSSLLVAKNEDDKVIGYATMESLDKVKEKIGVIEHLHLDYDYTKENLGTYLLYKITQTAKGQFSDIVTKSPHLGGHDIYKDLGFTYISPSARITEVLNPKYADNDYQGWMRKNLNYYS